MTGKSTLLDKWKLVRAAAKDNKRLSLGDVAVLFALCDRYGSKYDPDAPALAGHALLGSMAGLSRRATIDSTRRLIDAGYIAVLELGSGTRGTRYSLNFARGEDSFTAKAEHPSSEPDFTTVVNRASPLDPLSSEAHFTESPPTVAPLQEGLHVVGNMFDAAPVAPPADGLEATAAGPASGDGFNDFWKAWPRKHGKKKAEAVWKKIDAELRPTIIEAATAWAEHYKHHDVEKKWIPEPANWLAGERWDEDLPLVHIDAKGAAITKAKANATPKTTEGRRNNSPRIVDIVDSNVDEKNGKVFLTLCFAERDRPETWEHVIALQHPDMKTQEEAQAEFAELCKALGVSGVSESSELHHPVRILQGPKGKLEYLPAPSNDDLREAA